MSKTFRTAEEWFNDALPAHIAAAAIRNLKTPTYGEYSSLPSALEGAFVWSHSPEGGEFWRELCRQYLAIEIIELPNLEATRKAKEIVRYLRHERDFPATVGLEKSIYEILAKN